MNPARPLIIRPPLPVRVGEDHVVNPRETFVLELILVGSALHVFPYLVQAVARIGQIGIGYGRGRFTLQAVEAFHPITEARSVLYSMGGSVTMPDQPINAAQVACYADTLADHRLHLHFMTPTQLICDGKLLNRPRPDTILLRALERLQLLELHYGTPESQAAWKQRHDTLGQHAQAVRVRRDDTRWQRAYSGSRRANRLQDVSGFVGSILLEGEIAPLRLWLAWASLVNIGKNAIKGNGWMAISS